MKQNNRSINKEEFESLLSSEQSAEYRALYTLLFLTGMRVSEALSITRNDVEITPDNFILLEAKTLKRKGHPLKTVLINLDGSNKDLIDEYLRPFLWVKRLSPSEKLFSMSRFMVYLHAKELGFGTVHNLRRSFINNMADAGASEHDIVSMLNLSSSRALPEYLHKFKVGTIKEHLVRLGV